MPLNATTLATALTPEIKSCFTTHLGAIDNATLLAFSQALATALATKIVDHIKANASVITSCGAGAGTGTVT